MLKGFVLTTLNKLPQVKPDLVRVDLLMAIQKWLKRNNLMKVLRELKIKKKRKRGTGIRRERMKQIIFIGSLSFNIQKVTVAKKRAFCDFFYLKDFNGARATSVVNALLSIYEGLQNMVSVRPFFNTLVPALVMQCT